ncbi:uncharacterized protein LTR77_000721 [Saxophila tyrrhenica]|uniref:Rhodopsin domain-containing protein n=1 Tax=Saxophila tyrrhenica TaxID=1690608 RepID=A0AAV9PRQ0_9PEZI|nr:hypothetical protein LTR77_000721 [Saxophila tyrrhenica]
MALGITRWQRRLFGGGGIPVFALGEFAEAVQILSVVQTGLILRAEEDGLGEKLDRLQQFRVQSINKFVYARDVLFILALAFSKASVCLLLQRFSSHGTQAKAAMAMMVLCVVYSVAGVLLVALRNDLSHPWMPESSLQHAILAQWATCSVLGSLIDISTMVFPIFLVWDLQMAKESKRRVVMGFFMRMPVVALSVARVVAVSRLDYADFTFSYTVVEIYTQLELHYCVASATTPCLHVFLKGWNTGYLGTALEEVDQQAYEEWADAKSDGASYHMTPLHTSKEHEKQTSSTQGTSLQGGHGISQAAAQHSKAGQKDAARDSSQQVIVVRTTVDVDIE